MKYIFIILLVSILGCSQEKLSLENIEKEPSSLIGEARTKILADLGNDFYAEYYPGGFPTKKEWSDANQKYRKVASWWAYEVKGKYLKISFKDNKCIKAEIVAETGQEIMSPALTTTVIEENE